MAKLEVTFDQIEPRFARGGAHIPNEAIGLTQVGEQEQLIALAVWDFAEPGLTGSVPTDVLWAFSQGIRANTPAGLELRRSIAAELVSHLRTVFGEPQLTGQFRSDLDVTFYANSGEDE